MLTILIPVAVIAVIIIIAVLAFQRGREGFDVSGSTVLRAYLYLGSFAGVIALAFGLSGLLNGALATVAGNEIVYGGAPIPAIAPFNACPVGASCPPTPDIGQIVLRQRQESDRRRQEDLLRGATFAVFGAIFYGTHRTARNTMYPRRQGSAGDGLGRAYHLLGTVVFGIGAIALLPAGLYQLLANSVLTLPPDAFRPGVADTLTGGVVSTVLWLLYLRAVLADTRGGEQRSAGAEAQRPRERD